MCSDQINNYKNFKLFNSEKIKRASLISPQKLEIALNVIPFLIHSNHRDLPTYLDLEKPPVGIHLFQLTKEMKRAVTKHFHKEKIFETQATVETVVESLMLMGSIGSIAQSEKSDFDYWVCIDGKATHSKKFKLLEKRLTSIEKWAQEQDMEVHFFLTDINLAKKNDFGDINKESVGTALGKLLKEEFYRTLTHVCGKIPLWWVSPPGINDEEYLKYRSEIEFSLEMSSDEFVDLGNITEISYNEYFGAALWQMNKALISPYKSVLKMALLESFMDPTGCQEILCDTLKKNAFSNLENIKTFDPYRIMFDRILDYYSNKGRMDVVDLLRRCFYIKVAEKVKPGVIKSGDSYKISVMKEYVNKWGWEARKCEDLNKYTLWGFEKMLKLGGEVHSFLIQTYKNLTDHLKKESNSDRKLSDIDLTILGRKLFSFYSKKPNKIEPLKNAFDEPIILDSITFSVDLDKNRRPVWSLLRGQLSRQKLKISKECLLKQGDNLPELITWMVFNRLFDNTTSLYLIPNPQSVSLQEIQRLTHDLKNFFPPLNISELPNNALLEDARKTKIYAVLNFSSQHWVDKVEEVTIIYSTSWGEHFCKNYKGMNGIKKFIDFINDSPSPKSKTSNYYRIFSPPGVNFLKIRKKINEIILNQLGIEET